MASVAKSMANPFVFTDRMLYNPKLSYLNYLLLGYIAVFLQQVMLSGVGILMIKDGERIAGTFIIKETLLKILSCAFYVLLSVAAAIQIAAWPFDELLFKGVFPVEGFKELALFTLIWLPVSIILFNYRFKVKEC